MKVGNLVRHKFFDANNGCGVVLAANDSQSGKTYYQIKWLSGNQSRTPQWFPMEELVIVSEKLDNYDTN